MALALGSIVVKSNYHTDLRRFTWSASNSFAQLLHTLSSLYGRDPNKLVVKYLDDEGDTVKVASTEEFIEAIRLAALATPPILRIIVEDGEQALFVMPPGVAASFALVPQEVSDSRIFSSPSALPRPTHTTPVTAGAVITPTTSANVASPSTITTTTNTSGTSFPTSTSTGTSASTSTSTSISGRIKASQLPTWGKRTSPGNSAGSATGSSLGASPSSATSSTPSAPAAQAPVAAAIPSNEAITRDQLVDLLQQLFPEALQIAPTMTTSTPVVAATASPATATASQPIPIKNETVRESVLRVADQTQQNLMHTSCQVRDIISESCDQQHRASLAQSPPAATISTFDANFRELGSSVHADCMLQSDDIAQKLVAARAASASASSPAHESWTDSVIASAVAQRGTLEADCKSISDALFERLRAV